MLGAFPVHASGLDAFPPVVQLLLREMANWPSTCSPDVHKRIKGMLKDLKQQAEHTISEHHRILAESENQEQPRSSAAFNWHLPPDLDPLTSDFKCGNAPCRERTTNQIAKFIGLYADTAFVPDRFSFQVASAENWTHLDTRWLMENIKHLAELAPLVAAGIVRFSSPTLHTCIDCKEDLTGRIKRAAEEIALESGSELIYEREGLEIVLDFSNIDDVTPILRHSLSPAERKMLALKKPHALKKIALRHFRREISAQAYETLIGTSATRPFGAVTITGSRVNSLLLRRVSAEQDSTTEWETARATNLPWVKDLTVAETIILRNEAANALPRFRAKMSHAFSESGAARDGEIKKLVAELHDEALEVEQEIRCADPAAEKRFQSVVGSVSIVAAVFGAGALGGGITAGAAAGAAAGLASILGHIHKGNREPHRELQRNQSRPGFVLLKSKELLGHASSGP